MFGLSPIRLYAYAAIALALAGLLAHDHWMSRRYKAANAQLRTAEVTLITERENTRKEHESAQRYASRLAISRGPRSPPPRVMCRIPASVPTAGAASGTDAAAQPDDSGVLEEVDLGPRLDVSFHACEENLIALEELQRWVMSR